MVDFEWNAHLIRLVDALKTHVIHLGPRTADRLEEVIRETPVCRAAYALAIAELPEPILNHSIRTFVFALVHSTQAAAPYERYDLLYVTCMLHDLGASRYCASHPTRFEVAGADVASALLKEHSAPQEDVDAVWRAIALHSSAGIAERMGPPIDSVRHAVCIDFGKTEGRSQDLVSQLESTWPRMDVEVCLGSAVVEQVVQLGPAARQAKAPPASWPGVLVAAHYMYPDHVGKSPAF